MGRRSVTRSSIDTARCKSHTGGAIVCLTGYQRREIEWSGDERQNYHSSPGTQLGFCDKCGAPSTWEGTVEKLGGELIEFLVGTTDDPEALTPMAHIWSDERIKWFDMVDELPRYHGWLHNDHLPLAYGPIIEGKVLKPPEE